MGRTDCWDRTDSYDDIIIEARNVDSHGHKTKKELDAGHTFVVFCFFQHFSELGNQDSISSRQIHLPDLVIETLRTNQQTASVMSSSGIVGHVQAKAQEVA